MKTLLVALALTVLVSCAAGPVYIAKTEQEAIRATYQDPKLVRLSTDNRATLVDLYRRFQMASIDVYPNGIGFTTLTNNNGRTYYYLFVDVRPRDITFGEERTKPDERFNEVVRNHLEKNLRYVHAEDLQKTGADGLAFAVHWPVRDLSQCDTHGGFLEYAMLYMIKADFLSYANGGESLSDTLRKAEVYRSLDRQGPEPVRVVPGR
jgi:hypothetical protein